MYRVLFYELVDDYIERRAALRDVHLGLARAAADRGDLVLAGALADPYDRAVLVWDTDDAAPIEAFVAADPYVEHGLVTSWTIRDWTVVVGAALPPAG